MRSSLRPRRVVDAAEGLRARVSGGGLPRDAGARRGPRLLKWVTSFPGNPAQGLPTVSGLVLLSDASNGMLARRARRGRGHGAPHRRRRGARGRDARPLGRATAAVVGAGVNGKAAARTFLARGRDVGLYDVDPSAGERSGRPNLEQSLQVVARGGAGRRPPRDDDSGSRDPAPRGLAPPGQHVSLMGADGPGRRRSPSRSFSRPDLRRRLGTGQPQRRARARSRARLSPVTT